MLSVDPPASGSAPTESDDAALAQEGRISEAAVTALVPDLDLGHLNGPAGNTYVAHCNHYNCFLQRTLRSKSSLNMDEVLVDTAGMLFFLIFVQAFDAEWNLRERLAYAEAFFKARGYGNPSISRAVDDAPIKATASHHSDGYRAKFGVQNEPQDFFLTGAIQGALMAAYGSDVQVTQTTCRAMDDDVNTWTYEQVPNSLDRVETYLERAKELYRQRAAIDAQPRPETLPAPPVTSAVRNMTLVGDEEEGLIPAFNVQLTFIPSLYYNVCSQVFLDRLEESGMKRRLGRRLLKEAGHVCGFYTLGNILLSSEYALLRQSHFGPGANESDSMTTLFGVVNALGWGYWTLDELASDTMRFSVANSYEAYNYREYFGRDASEPTCILHIGGGEAIMNALRHGNILNVGGPIDDDYVNDVFASSDGFTAEEPRCFAQSESHACHFLVTR